MYSRLLKTLLTKRKQQYKIYEPGDRISMRLLLRRTLVLQEMLEQGKRQGGNRQRGNKALRQ